MTIKIIKNMYMKIKKLKMTKKIKIIKMIKMAKNMNWKIVRNMDTKMEMDAKMERERKMNKEMKMESEIEKNKNNKNNNKNQKMRLKTILLTILLIAAIASTNLYIPASAQDGSNELLGTGLLEPTSDELGWIQGNMINTKEIRPNELGLQRMNKHLKEKGKDPLKNIKTAQIGEEATYGGTAITTEEANTLLGALPNYVDNSQLPYFPPIRNQGRLSSCVAFATTYYQMTHMTALARNWNTKDNNDNSNKFSPKWTYNMINNGNDAGSSFSNAYQLLLKNGASSWSDFPYDSDYRQWSTNQTVWQNAISYKADKTGIISGTNTIAGINAVKSMLNNGYVLTFGTYISSWQYSTIKNDPATAEDDMFAGKSICSWMNGTNNGHAMVVVGYNDNIWTDINNNNAIDTGEKGAFRIANSWGTSWMEAGFTWLSYDALFSVSQVSGGPGTGRVAAWASNYAYWVTAKTSYTPKLLARLTTSHLKRNQLAFSLGYSSLSQTSPSAYWSPFALYNKGGAYSFNGTTSECEGSFVLDFTDLMLQYGLTNPSDWQWYLKTSDNLTDGNTGVLKSFSLFSPADNKVILSREVFPVTVENSYILSKGDLTIVESTPASTPAPTTTPTIDSTTVPSPTPAITPDPTPAPAQEPTPVPTSTPTPVSPTVTPLPTVTTDPTPIPTTAVTPTPTPTPTPTVTPTPTPTPKIRENNGRKK